MYVYVYKNHRYEVGFFTPGAGWALETAFELKAQAARRVNYLNGGTGKSPDCTIIEEVD